MPYYQATLGLNKHNTGYSSAEPRQGWSGSTLVIFVGQLLFNNPFILWPFITVSESVMHSRMLLETQRSPYGTVTVAIKSGQGIYNVRVEVVVTVSTSVTGSLLQILHGRVVVHLDRNPSGNHFVYIHHVLTLFRPHHASHRE